MDSPASDSESIALRAALMRLEQDNYALQQALSRVTDERDRWRESYYELTRETK